MTKDYYSILHLSPSATLPEIKQAYRKLAMTWHPDKNPGDNYAKTQFEEIKEAYEVLTNPAKKNLYLQERWYDQSLGRKKTAVTITPVNILKLTLELERYVASLDRHRMNKEGLSHYIEELFSQATVEKLREFNEPDIKRQMIVTCLAALEPLPLQWSGTAVNRLQQLAGTDARSLEIINDFQCQQRRSLLWNRNKIFLVIIITALICLLIFITSK